MCACVCVLTVYVCLCCSMIRGISGVNVLTVCVRTVCRHARGALRAVRYGGLVRSEHRDNLECVSVLICFGTTTRTPHGIVSAGKANEIGANGVRQC